MKLATNHGFFSEKKVALALYSIFVVDATIRQESRNQLLEEAGQESNASEISEQCIDDYIREVVVPFAIRTGRAREIIDNLTPSEIKEYINAFS